jgi:hypothetical protein
MANEEAIRCKRQLLATELRRYCESAETVADGALGLNIFDVIRSEKTSADVRRCCASASSGSSA